VDSGSAGLLLAAERAVDVGARILLRAAAGGTPNGVYIHDRRTGSRVEVVNVDSSQLGMPPMRYTESRWAPDWTPT
jgi:hypothetical protein